MDDCRCYGNPSKTTAEPKVTRPTPCCPCPCPTEKCKITLQTVQKLVEAENKDIELSELLGGITALDEVRPKKKIIDMYDATSKANREDTVRSLYHRRLVLVRCRLKFRLKFIN